MLTPFDHVKMVGTANEGDTPATGVYEVLGGALCRNIAIRYH
jgi:hypothetical protein